MTGFQGKERDAIKNMIYMIGAKYTGYLSRSVTHLICQKYVVFFYFLTTEEGMDWILLIDTLKFWRSVKIWQNLPKFIFLNSSQTSEKYKKAVEWGIVCTNARWISDIMTGEFTF